MDDARKQFDFKKMTVTLVLRLKKTVVNHRLKTNNYNKKKTGFLQATSYKLQPKPHNNITMSSQKMLMLVFLVVAPFMCLGQGTTNVGVVYKWSSSNVIPKNLDFVKASSSSSGKKVVVVCDKKGIIISSDSGATFAQASGVPAGREWESVASSDDGQVLLASGEGMYTLYKSADGGATWEVTHTTNNHGYDNVAVSASGTSLMAYSDAFYSSSDSGTSWSTTAFASGANQQVSIAFGATDQEMFVCTTSGVDKSADAGASVNSIYSERCDNMAVSRDGKHIVINSGGPVVTSHDGGTNWVTKSFKDVTGVTTNSNNGWKDLAISDDGQTICAANEWKGVFISTDGGLTKYNRVQSAPDRSRMCTVSGDGENIVVGSVYQIRIGSLVKPTSPSPSKSTSTGSGGTESGGTGSGTSSSGTTSPSAGTGTSGTCTASDCGKCTCDCQGIKSGVQTSNAFQSTENFCDAEGCTKRLGEDECPSTNSQISAMWIKDLPKASPATSVNSQMCAAMTIGLCAATAIINGGM